MLFSFLAVVVNFSLARGTAEVPSAVFPIKPGEAVTSFAWTDDGLCVDGTNVPWRVLGVGTPSNGTSFVWHTRCSDGEQAFVKGTLTSAVSRYKIEGFDRLDRREPNCRVTIVPVRDGHVKLDMTCKGTRSPVFRATRQIKVSKGNEVVTEVSGKTTDLGWCRFVLEDIDGTVLFKPDIWVFRDRNLKFAIRVLHTDCTNQVMYVRSDNWFDRSKPHTLRVEMFDFTAGDLRWKTTIPAKPYVSNGYYNSDGKMEQPVDISSLPPGRFKCVVTLVGPDGKDVAGDYAYYAKPSPGGAPWEGTVYGIDDGVPPPWTAPVFGAEGFDCWNRRVIFGGGGVVSSMTSDGRELLASPVALVLNGKPLEFEARLASSRASEAVYRLKAKGADVMVDVKCEFDGFMWFDVTYGASVHSLDVVVPVRRDLVVGFDDCSSVKEKMLLPRGKTCSIDYDASKKPYWWIGSTVGLMGGTDTFRGRRLKNVDASARIDANEVRAAVTMRLVDTPAAVGDVEKRTCGFYLQPTPVKPKDMALTATTSDKIVYWTGKIERFFEDKWHGQVDMEKYARFAKELAAGKRVFFYCATKGASTSFPWWGWFGSRWSMNEDPEIYAEEIPFKDRVTKDCSSWINACPNEKSFLEFKIWNTCEFLWNPQLAVKDLYWDLPNPSECPSAVHGCRWKDEFGRTWKDRPMRTCREIHKRVYREVKKKNRDGAMLGHLTCMHVPSESFFDLAVMGEVYERLIRYSLNYYDVLTPDDMLINYAARSSEMTIIMLPQIYRVMHMYDRARLRTYNPNSPENDRVVRHGEAYFKIYDLNIGNYGDRWLKTDRLLAEKFGPNRRHSAFYTKECPVTVVEPAKRFLYAFYEGEGHGLLILLNDTDMDVEKTVTLSGFEGTGEDVFSGDKHAFRKEGCVFRLPPRESRFIYFDKFR